MNKDAIRTINFYDDCKDILFLEDFKSLKSHYGFDFKKTFKKFCFNDGDDVIFNVPRKDLYDFFKTNYGTFDYLRTNDILEDFNLEDNDNETLKKDIEDDYVCLQWQPISDDEGEHFWIQVEPGRTSLCFLDFLFKDDETFWFAYEEETYGRYVVILWKRNMKRKNIFKE